MAGWLGYRVACEQGKGMDGWMDGCSLRVGIAPLQERRELEFLEEIDRRGFFGSLHLFFSFFLRLVWGREMSLYAPLLTTSALLTSILPY